VVAAKKPEAIRARTREGADAGIRDCLDLMTSGRWVTGKSHAAIATLHGVAETTAKDWATNASRMLRLLVEVDVEDIRCRLVASLEGICADARDAGDHRAAVGAVDSMAKLLGLVVQKHEVAMTPAEADAIIAEAVKLQGAT